jgi:hypothetical protein
MNFEDTRSTVTWNVVPGGGRRSEGLAQVA